jgi:putative colanic acid biosynthesis UDP-glucose lipid carrier transferase
VETTEKNQKPSLARAFTDNQLGESHASTASTAVPAPKRPTGSFASLLARGAAMAVLLLGLGIVTEKMGWTDPTVLVAWVCLTPMVGYLGGLLARDVTAGAVSARAFERRVVIVGANAPGKRFRTSLTSVPGVAFCGFFDDRSIDRVGVAREELLGSVAEVPGFCQTGRADVVYVALPVMSQPRTADMFRQLNDTTVSVYLLPDIFLSALCAPMRPRLDMVAGTPVVQLCETPFLGMNAVIKRTEDLVLGTILLLLCLPVMLGIAAAIRLDSPGPIIFRQRRHGLDGREIVVYKFRTMRVLEDGSEFRQAKPGDARVTKVGAFLRRYSLDELPQLVNVLQGRMSLVGPRPHPIALNDLYRNAISGYMIRHKVRPGITGWAQVNGFRGETDTVEKMKARIEHDLAYLSDWSLFLDLSILARTAWAVVTGRNAY